MKRNLIYVLFITLLIMGCQKGEKELITTVSGYIINPIGNTVTFRIGEKNVVDTLDESNQFRVYLDLTEPNEIRFRHGNEITYLYLRPGDDLSMSLDTDAFDETLIYEGTGAEINRYNAAMVLLLDSVGNTNELFALSEDSFLKTLASLEQVKLSYLDSFGIKDTVFRDYMRGAAKWEEIVFKINYEDYYKRIHNVDTFILSKDYYTFLNELDINDSTQFKYPNFESYVSYMINESINSSTEVVSEDNYYKIYYETVSNLITVNDLKEKILYKLLNMHFSYIQDDIRRVIITEWRSLNPSEKKIVEINKMVDDWQKIAPGQPAPSFKFVNMDGDSLTLEDFRGKLVYIDVWATWCGPCIAEHPYMAKLQERFKDQEVIFVSVSIDPEPSQWKEMVRKKELGGIHLYAPGQYQSKINRDYLINGIPRFILISKEGKIIDANASRPSGNIGKQIAELLATT